MWDYLVKRLRGTDRQPLVHPEVTPAHDTSRTEPVSEHPAGAAAGAVVGGKHGRHLECPVCDTPMRTEKIGSIEIDRCAKCGGIFLDKGELESIARYLELNTEEPPPHHLVYTPHGWE